MSKKQSLYEILAVSPNAHEVEIRAAHEKMIQALEAQRPSLSHEDYTLRLRVLKVALSTLSAPNLRAAYDAHLSVSAPAAPGSALQVMAAPADKGVSDIRADAMLMRAEALALRADALGLKADVLAGHGPDATAPVKAALSHLGKGFKTVLLTLGTLAALSMVLKIIFMFTASGSPDQVGGVRNQAAEDKVFLQDYYQTHGVRPANRAEAALMDAERRKTEEARRAQSQQEDEKKKAAQVERDFEEDAHRRGEQVAAELRFEAEKARQAQAQEDRQKAEEERRKAEAERRRIDAEQAKWQRILNTPSPD